MKTRPEKTIFDYTLLKGRIKDVYGGQESFAQALGCTLQTINNKLNNRTCFTQDEIILWAEMLDLRPYQIGEFFLNARV